MAKTISFSDIQQRSQKKYGDLTIDGLPGGPVTLVNALRLPEKKRKKLAELEKNLKDPSSDTDAVIEEFIVLAAGAENGKRLIKAAGGDLSMLVSVIEEYAGVSELGEASGSVSS